MILFILEGWPILAEGKEEEAQCSLMPSWGANRTYKGVLQVRPKKNDNSSISVVLAAFLIFLPLLYKVWQLASVPWASPYPGLKSIVLPGR